jgi:hypothetical protein
VTESRGTDLSARRRVAALATAFAAIGGVLAACHYHQLGLTLSHYDARGHLVVARRIFDSITPGWQQIGAVWLPLPHLLNAVPVQIDLLYRTGLSGVAISVASFAVSAGSIAWIVARLTGSPWAAATGALVFALNPNLLYLQATPMTEPLMMAFCLAAVALVVEGCAGDPYASFERRNRAWSVAGVVFALACLTRYEAWPVLVATLVAAAWARWRAGEPRPDTVAHLVKAAGAPFTAIAGFLIFSRIVVGSWFPADFFVPENPSQGQPLAALADIAWGVHALSGSGLLAAAALGLLTLTVAALTRPAAAFALIPLALMATAAVPWVAFVDGHPYRIRYMAPLLAAQAVFTGAAAGWWRRARVITVPALVVIALFELRPLDASAPMLTEAQWDLPNADARNRVGRRLAAEYRGETIMASMGSLGHYMQNLSHHGLGLHDFLHEGNGDIWLAALDDPRPYAGWMLLEEKAEGGDMLAKRARENPTFLAGFSRVCDGAGVALYRRRPAPAHH